MKKSILEILESEILGNIHSTEEFKEYYSVDASSYKIVPKIIVIPKNEKDSSYRRVWIYWQLRH